MRRFLPKGFTIRQKVIGGFALTIAIVLLISVLAYRNLLTIERKVRFVFIVQQLQNEFLEVRRQEKNYLLYGHRESFQEALDHLERGKKIIARIKPHAQDLRAAPYLAELERNVIKYEKVLRTLGVSLHTERDFVRGPGTEITSESGNTQMDLTHVARFFEKRDEIEPKLRDLGRRLVNYSQQLSDFEHSRIQRILQSLKSHLGYTSLILVSLGGFLAFLVTRKIVQPLRIVEKTTQRIAKGEFESLPVPATKDETQSVIEAFNEMVSELKKRQAQLLEAQKLSSLGVLTSGVAHQLNNPLNNISTSCQILSEEIGDNQEEQVKKLLTNIDQEGDRARDIVKSLLEFAREREFQLNWINLQDLVMKTFRLISSQLPAGVEVSIDVPEDLEVYADSQKLEEVLLSLLFNASDAMQDGTGLITITAKEDSDNNQMEINVQDTGCGIPPEMVSQIFDPFFTTKELGYGTGLGLSVAHGIVQQHGGTLSVDSKPGEGSVFTIRLPLGNNRR